MVLHDLPGTALEMIGVWMRQVEDLPMDLADASLLWVAQLNGIECIATLDRRDFGVYRLPGGGVLHNVLEEED
jgi:hypothetical protein